MWQHTKVKAGLREDIGVKVRSGWEASVIRWLNWEGIEWEYEPKRFYYPVQRGTRSYTPDLYLPNYKGGKWVEIKGSLAKNDPVKIRRFKRHCPTEFAKLMVIPGSPKTEAAKFFAEMEVPVLAYFLDLNKEFKDQIPHWSD